MATLGLKEMGKFLWEGREKVSFAKLRQPTGQSFKTWINFYKLT